MDAVYLVRAGVNEDLRYSLRSLAANVPHDRVWIVGHMPSWCGGVEHLPSRSHGSKWANLPADLLAASRTEAISATFAYWNDDFFCVAPVDGVPLYHRGPLSEYVGKRGRVQGSAYLKGQRETLKLLRAWGYPEPLSFETHMPIVFDKGILRDVLERLLSAPAFSNERRCACQAPAYRSLYGAVAGLEGERIEDMKRTGRNEGIPAGWDWVSTSDASWETGKMGKQLRAMFPEPCQYERAPR